MINTERLNLMIPSPSRLIGLYDVCSYPQANIYAPKGLHSSRLNTQRQIEKWRNHWQQYQFSYFVLVKKMDCSVTGICGYEYRQLKRETVSDLFYKSHPSSEGQGHACEAIIAIINFVNYIGQETVKIIRTNKCNQRSINLAERPRFK